MLEVDIEVPKVMMFDVMIDKLQVAIGFPPANIFV